MTEASSSPSNRVAIAAFGQTAFSRDDSAVEDVMFDSVRSLFRDNPGVDKKEIDVVLASTTDNAKYMGAIVSETAGIRPRTSHTVESMCNSGTNAIVSAYSYVASGLGRAALVVGADRFDCPGQILGWDQARGEFGHPVFWASIFSRSYRDAFGVSAEDLASIPAKNHKSARDNPHAISERAYTVEEVLASKRLTEDLRLLECSRPSTGGSAVLLASGEIASRLTDTPVWITGIGQMTLSAGFTSTDDLTAMRSTAEASRHAFRMAGIDPGQVDVAEVHDAFAVCEAMAVEDLGMAEKGSGASFARELYETGNRMINPRGGLIGSGHPPGATGIAQTVEVALQLQNGAGRRQVDSPETGLVHNMSAAATSSTVLVMSN